MELWSWLLTLTGVTGMYVVGKKNRSGWLIAAGSQLLWITFGAITGQYGFIIAALIYGTIFIKNYINWSKEDK